MPPTENIARPPWRPRTRAFRRLASFVLLLTAAVTGAPVGPADGPATVFFFSPETNVNNFSTLKGEFDSYFATAGNHKFQPFADRAAFEAALREKRAGLYLMSSWHYTQFTDKAGLDPALIGVLRGKSTQRHILCAKNSVANAAALRGMTIASAGTREFTQNLLREILGKDQDALIATFKILTVPKDIDALMGVGFGVAQAAVSTESGLERLSKTNAKQHEQLNQLAVGPEKLLPIVVAHAKPDAACEALLKVLTGIPPEREGGNPLKLLGLEGLKPVEADHRKALQP